MQKFKLSDIPYERLDIETVREKYVRLTDSLKESKTFAEQEKIHDKNFRFTLTTNGVLLDDDIMEFANKEMANVVLSIDGRKEIHDLMRPFRKGAGSYDLIVPKF